MHNTQASLGHLQCLGILVTGNKWGQIYYIIPKKKEKDQQTSLNMHQNPPKSHDKAVKSDILWLNLKKI